MILLWLAAGTLLALRDQGAGAGAGGGKRAGGSGFSGILRPAVLPVLGYVLAAGAAAAAATAGAEAGGVAAAADVMGRPGLTGGLSVTLAAAAGFFLILSSPPPSGGSREPETGDTAGEWAAGAVLAAALLLPSSPAARMLALTPLLRFGFGLVFRIIPVRLSESRPRQVLGRMSWIPAAAAAALSAGAAAGGVYAADPVGSTGAFTGTALMAASIAAAAVRVLFHLEEGYRRLSALGRMVPSSMRRGLLSSYAIYYLVPLRTARMARFYKALLPGAALAWDVGAHLGNRSRVWLNLGWKVRAFEPQPACAALLENWFGDCPRFSLSRCAVGERAGTARLRISGRHPTLSSVSEDWVERMERHPLFNGISWSEQINVEQISLREAETGGGTPDFLKVDVEGGEAAVLRGLGGLPKSLSFEILPADRGNALVCVNILASKGRWEWNVALRESFRFLFPAAVDLETISKWITGLSDSQPSGDIYARLIDEN
jgi:FkbM family methyltransferase